MSKKKLLYWICLLDLLLYNSADTTFSVGSSSVNAVVYYDGTVTYLPPGMFKSTCLIRIDDFPFDQQICELKVNKINIVTAKDLVSSIIFS